ncbi:MAG TPA: site-specific integrase [Candidatus Acidoferrales bacterium]|nr:site-specific integrase [Candidatus Acidoferrales bacterium]
MPERSKQRRRNGEGTEPRRVSANSFEIRLRVSGKPDKYIYGNTPADCIRKRNKYLASDEAVVDHTGEEQHRTCASQIERFLSKLKKSDAHGNTYRSYESICQLYLVPEIGKLNPKKLTGRHIESLIDEMETRFNDLEHEGKPGPGSRTRQLTWIYAKAIFSETHPLLLKKIPRPNYIPREMQCWTDAETEQFVDWIVKINDPMAMIYQLGVATGLRKGECLALTVERFNPATRILQIQQTWLDKDDKPGPLKTSSSKRPIVLPPDLAAALEEFIDQRRDANGDRLERKSLIFNPREGFSPTWVSHHLKTLAEEAGVPIIRFHDLRHTFATSALVNGVNVKLVSEILGHASIKITLQIYAHIMPGQTEEAMEIVAQAQAGKRPNLRLVS